MEDEMNFSEMLFNRDERLLDYITNLQEENEKVHKDFDELSERYFFTKSRNEKAIEYIDNLRDESAEREGFYNCFPDDLYIPNIDELLNILNGDDK